MKENNANIMTLPIIIFLFEDATIKKNTLITVASQQKSRKKVKQNFLQWVSRVKVLKFHTMRRIKQSSSAALKKTLLYIQFNKKSHFCRHFKSIITSQKTMLLEQKIHFVKLKSKGRC